MSVTGPWRRARQADRSTAVAVGVGDVLLCSVLCLTMIGATPFFEPTTREQETAAWQATVPLFGVWLVGGLMLFGVLGMPRTALSHLLAMLLPPTVLVLLSVVVTA
ncbi:hypothetical protein WBG99_32505 [Streptomyces sp. TG1A-60]|uniref:hypothetical protein n=1 Tax=Streptomyces sp. TG1A-60 TaxID=3129111 RepID=UPI0030D141AA